MCFDVPQLPNPFSVSVSRCGGTVPQPLEDLRQFLSLPLYFLGRGPTQGKSGSDCRRWWNRTKVPLWCAGSCCTALRCSPYRSGDSHHPIDGYICTWVMISWYICTWAKTNSGAILNTGNQQVLGLHKRQKIPDFYIRGGSERESDDDSQSSQTL